MNILSIIYKHKYGGFHIRMYQLFRYLLESGDNIHVVCAEKLPISHPRLVQHIIHPPLSNKEGLIFWLYFIFASQLRTFRIAARYKIRKIVTFGPFYTLLCAIPIITYKIASITFIRADNMKHSNKLLRNAFFFIADWLGIMLSSRLVSVSKTLRDVYVRRYRVSDQNWIVLPNNIKTLFTLDPSEKVRIRTSLEMDNDNFLIATAGVFNEGKNFSFLIQAMKDLAPHKIKLLIIGDEVVLNGERQRLEKMADDLAVTSHVIFTGWKDDPRPFISSSDVFVFPSRHEGSPNALLEALGCGVPCLGSNIREIEEVLLYSELLFPLEERALLVDKVLKLSSDSLHYDHTRILSQERCSQFCFDWGHRVYSIIHSAS